VTFLASFLAVALAVPQGVPKQIPADVEPVTTTESGLKYCVLAPGQPGESPKFGDKVVCHYTGWLTNGTVFESSRTDAKPAEFQIGDVIEGWDEALQHMTPGAHWKLVIPSDLGYGERGNPPDIKPGMTLVFELELLSFEKGPPLPPFHPANPEKQKATESGLKIEPLVEGTGDTPKAEDIVELKFAIWTTKGRLLECTEKSKQHFRGKAMELPFRVLQLAPQYLKIGGRSRFEVPAELALRLPWYGSTFLPIGSPTVWEIELVKTLVPPVYTPPDPSKQQTTKSGLKYEVLKEGTGAQCAAGDKVTVIYSGWTTDGMLFDSSKLKGGTADFVLKGALIAGWLEGIPLMKEGASWRFEIPGKLGYGPGGNPRAKIPPNATLVFDIELIKTVKQ
jgi:FKBP-type peptidyl-prolyl cis-trans isomerase